MKSKLKFLIIILSFLVMICSLNTSVVYAQTTEYTDVFEDLRKDETFTAENYPSYTYEEIKTLNEDLDPTNNVALMDVISLAEGYNKELYIYVYNPTKTELNITATQISMYCEYVSNPKEFHPQLYDLELVSTYSVFDKYLVKDFVVSDEADRYYNIIELSRPFNETIDTSIDNGTTDDKAIAIGKQWYCYYFNDELIYEMGQFKTLEIKVTLNGNIYYGNGFTIGNLAGLYEKSNSWFIAFNAENYIIEHIYDADLTYKYRDVREYDDYTIFNDDSISYTPSDGYYQKNVTITDQDQVTHEGKGLFGKTYTWNRISSASDFVSNFENQGGTLNNTTKETLLQSQWVFAFAETECDTIYNQYTDPTTGITMTNGVWDYYTEVSQVDILRVSFVDITGKYYNLGVVADKTTADKIADGWGSGIDIDFLNGWFEKLGMLIGIIALLVILGFCGPILGAILNILLSVLKLVFKGVITIISLPFKLIGKLLKPKNKKP